MRIRRCASRLLGSDYASTGPPPFQLPPPPPFELPVPLPTPTPTPPPPPVLQPSSSAHPQNTGGLSASSAEPPCGDNRSPWDLMAQLDPSDPKELELFMETYFVSLTYRASWLFPPAAACIKQEQEEEEHEEEEVGMAVDMLDYVNDMPWHKVAKKKATKRTFTENRDEEKYASRPRKKAKVKTEEDEEYDGVADGGWMCKKNDGKTWFCRRTVSRPDSYCLYHYDPKRVLQRPASSAASKPSGSSKPRRRRALEVGEGFYYYAGFGPSRSKRQSRPSSSVMESPPAEEEEGALSEEKEEAPTGVKEEAPPEQKVEAPPEQKVEEPPKEHADFTTGQPQADNADHEVASAHIDEPLCDDMTGIAGCDEESSDDALCWNEPRVVGVNGGIKRKSPFKKRWRKPVKARSLKSLMT